MNDSVASDVTPHVLVLGAYGLIGSAVARRLHNIGCVVTGLGRSVKSAHSVRPDIEWIIQDLRTLNDEEKWLPILKKIDTVVNCAGALQQNYHDDLGIVHDEALQALTAVCMTKNIKLIQISAIGADISASTRFLATKARGDQAVRNMEKNYWIFRPGLILAPTAYGGSALLRMLAAMPFFQPLACPEAMVQTVSLEDVTEAVSLAVSGNIPMNKEFDLVEDQPHTLREVIALQRRWLGFSPAKMEIVIPDWLLKIVSAGADFLGRLGWRSPLRTSAITFLQEDISGDPVQWTSVSRSNPTPLHKTLSKTAATMEDRMFARAALLMPIVFAILFIFWLTSGLIGIFNLEKASLVLINAGWNDEWAKASIMFWSFVDIAIALALVVRKSAYIACWAAVAVSVIYLISATLVAPHLWLDPLGPLIKVLPGIILAMFARILLETR